MQFVWITDLCPEEFGHVHKQVEVTLGRVFLVHEELGTVGLFGDDIHPGFEGGGDGQVGLGCWAGFGFQFALVDDEVAGALDRAGEIELQGGRGVGRLLGIEPDLHDG
jgi:hypothetical protein